MHPPPVIPTLVKRWPVSDESGQDWLSVEEPLQIVLTQPGSDDLPLTTTLRTPGEDVDLAYGLLRSEGLLATADQVIAARHSGPPMPPHGARNILTLALNGSVDLQRAQLARFTLASASCGLCGKTAVETLNADRDYRPAAGVRVAATTLVSLPTLLRARQAQFRRSGGLHAAAIVSCDGELLSCREDIGRHNAVDKVLGDRWRHHQSTADRVLLLSGRGGFELIQKAVVADVPVVAAMGAPSSLAVQLARSVGMTLIGFLNGQRFNVYSGEHRVVD